MAHFAKIEDGNVITVIVAKQAFIDEHCDGTWVQTSYNTRGNIHYGQDGNADGGVALRGNFAGIGHTYDADNDVFYSPKPYTSWVLASTWEWGAPITYPADGKDYTWNEDVYQADNTKGWVEIE
tara:strand:+ start:200 stop:571 length:372 start_codon:yes stop_codon:yes gene_type:complete